MMSLAARIAADPNFLLRTATIDDVSAAGLVDLLDCPKMKEKKVGGQTNLLICLHPSHRSELSLRKTKREASRNRIIAPKEAVKAATEQT